jgi:tripartite-type tricarboxylate transporter receptor subunit TctC
MFKWAKFLSLGLGLLVAVPGSAQDNFYKDKTLTIIVGFGVGGGYDSYARLLSRHIGNFIPGNPTVVVQNMEGAGSLRAANHVYNVAPKDGTVIAAVNPTVLMFQILGGKEARYDSGKLNWLGSVANSNNSVIMWHGSGIKSVDDAKAKEIPVAGTGTTSYAYIYPTVMNATLGTKFKVINGYKGSADMDLAMESGEVAGRSGAALTSLAAEKADWVRDKKINFLVQIGFEKDPTLPDVPLLSDLVKTEREKQIVGVVTLPTSVGYAYWVAPEVPAERVKILREAVTKMVADPKFLEEAKKLVLDIRFQSGEQLQRIVENVANTPKPVIEETAAILKW